MIRFHLRWLWTLSVAVISIVGVQLLLIDPQPIARAAADEIVYADTLNWDDWSWGSSINFQNSTPVHAGSKSIVLTYTTGWAGLYLHATSPLVGSDYSALRFWVRGTGSDEHADVVIYYNDSSHGPAVSITATSGAWTPYTIPLTLLGPPTSISGIVWQENTGSGQPKFYLDEIALIAKPITLTTTIALSVNAQAGVHSISPYIYGLNFADENLANDLRLPIDRWGGNSTTRYNYLNDVRNTASDWYFENIPEDDPLPLNLPDGSAADQFIEKDRRTGAQTLLTIPMIGWTPKAHSGGHPYECGYSTSKYGTQTDADPYQTNCGNGISLISSQLITKNNPSDTSLAITPTFVQNWINYLKSEYGSASNGGVQFYNLDNEPMLWNSTHRDVHPQPTSYDEMLTRTIEYAAAIKATDPNAQTLGPAEWGWTGYFYSALDEAAGGNWWDNPPDRLAHGDVPFTDWYLQQLKAYELTHGQRILDYLDLHFYPQAAGVTLSPAGNAATQALRLRSTRSLWDPTYVDESWIGEAIYMLPRMKQWVNDNYPGTKLAIGEYNWGALDHINGALAQADVLGIFGREGLDLATLWDPPTSTMPGAYAFRMYRNYDGNHALFGELSVSAASTDQERLSIYAAWRGADNALTLMIINKSTASITAPLSLANYAPRSAAQAYRYSGSDLSSIVHLPDIGVSSSGFTSTYPASSITLVVLQPITDSYIITPTAVANGLIVPGTPQTVNSGASITFTITANTGYHTSDVRVDGVSQGVLSSYTFTNITANHTLTAAFAINLYTLTVAKTGVGIGVITPTIGVYTYTHGTVVTPAALANTGSTFMGWSGGCSGLSLCVINMTSAKSITANFGIGPSYILTITTAGLGSGLVTPTTGIYAYAAGSVVTVTSSANLYSFFSGWGGDCSGLGDCVVAITVDRAVVANFNQRRIYLPLVLKNY
jgi:hypothetical protein